MAMDLIASKVGVLILFGLLKFITGVAPSIILRRLKVHGKRKVLLDKAMGGVLCIGGGVLLATVFVHMLPEVRESLKTAKKQLQMANNKTKNDDHHGHDHSSHQGHGEHDDDHEGHDDEHGYPFAELVTCAGFFVIYFVEAIVHSIFMGVHGGNSGSHGHSHAIPAGMLKEKDIPDNRSNDANTDSGSSDHEKYAISTPNSSTTADSGVDNPGFRIENEGLGNGDLNENNSNGTLNKDGNGVEKNGGNDNFNNLGGLRLTSPTNGTSQLEHPDSAVWTKSPFSKKYKTHSVDTKDGTALNGLSGRSNVYNVSSATLTSYTTYNSEGGDHSLEEASLPNHYGLPTVDMDADSKAKANSDRERKVLFSVRNFLIVLALSVHSIFEGMAIGLQLSVQDVWKLFLAVSLHDVPVHFCVGMEMYNGGIKKLHIIIYFLILGIITPVGIIIGIVVTEHAGEGGDGTQTLVIGLLQGLAGGTLLYITFYEVLDREKLAKAGMTSVLGCVLLTCGFAFMAGLEAAGGHSHGVVQKNHGQDKNDVINQRLGMDNHHGHSHENNHEHELTTLRNAITKFDEYHTSEDWDLESEIKGINNQLEHDENESVDGDHLDGERENQSFDEHGHTNDEEHGHLHGEHDDIHEEEHGHIHEEDHDHIHDEEHDHNHDDGHHHNENDTPRNNTQSNLEKSMFLTLQHGR